MTTHSSRSRHDPSEWNNVLPPRLTIDPGDTVVFDTRGRGRRLLLAVLDPRRRPRPRAVPRPPLTGPVSVRGAQRGDVLTVEILDVKPGASFGWTAIRPGRGLMPEAEFAKPHLVIWDLATARTRRMGRNIAVPISAFPA